MNSRPSNPTNRAKAPRLRTLLIATALACGVILAAAHNAARGLIAPVARIVGKPPASFPAESIQFDSPSGSTISGWLSETDPPHRGQATILLLHGIRDDRRSMTGRARFLRAAGYHTLCIDFQAHGESPGSRITLGHRESQDAAAGVRYLKQRYPHLPVGVIGSSLGGAAALLAVFDPPPDAIVVEGVYADIHSAIANRLELRLGSVGRYLSPLFLLQIWPLLGIAPETLSPARAAARLRTPLLTLTGELDQHARPSEAEQIHAAALGPKSLWTIPGAAHVDLHSFHRAEYEQRVTAFFREHLAPLANPSPTDSRPER